MILIVTNKTDYTADYVIVELGKRNIKFVRLNTEDFPTNVGLTITINSGDVGGFLTIHDRTVDITTIRSVWYRRPMPSEPAANVTDIAAREFIVAESNATLQGFWRLLPCFWVSNPDKLRAAESKIYQLKVASTIGLIVPQTLATNEPFAAETFYRDVAPIIYKPQRGGRVVRGETVSLIYTNLIDQQHATQFDKVRLAPVLLQPYIPKQYEVRVTVVGRQVYAVALHSQEVREAQHDWRRVDARDIRHIPHQLPQHIEMQCIALVQELGLAFGAIDFIVTPIGEYVFLEINPNGQWAWVQQMCPELDIRDALIQLLIEGTS